MGHSFEYLETVTVYATEGFAYAEHRSPPVGKGRGTYRVARVTSATETKSAVQCLANTYMRMRDNGSFEFQVVDEMLEHSEMVMQRANYSRAKVRQAWRRLSEHGRYAQFCKRVSKRWLHHHDVCGSKRPK